MQHTLVPVIADYLKTKAKKKIGMNYKKDGISVLDSLVCYVAKPLV